MLEYHAAYYDGEGGWLVVELLDFPGVFSQGRSLKSARLMIKDALKLMAEDLLEEGKALPLPNPKAKAKKGAIAVEPIRLELRVRTAAAT
jgi:predicted RNase H-like HicB family nuclease